MMNPETLRGLLALGLIGAGAATVACGAIARAAAWQIESRYHWRALALSANILIGGGLVLAAGIGALLSIEVAR